MTDRKHVSKGGGLIGLLIGAVLLGGLLLYGAISGQELPLWPSILVVVVNILAAGNLLMRVRAQRKQDPSQKPD